MSNEEIYRVGGGGEEVPQPELSDEDREHIRATFYDEVVPKLQRMDARLGVLGCEFAGERFKNWTLEFRAKGSDFDILDFEYDEDAEGLDLDL